MDTIEGHTVEVVPRDYSYVFNPSTPATATPARAKENSAASRWRSLPR